MPAIFKDSSILNLPEKDEIEITLFGPGYGESIVLKIPDEGWFVIDSCKAKIDNSTIVPALAYLRALSVNSLAAVILTHPHEDHYLGIEEIIDEFEGRIRYVCRYSAEGIREFKAYLTQQHIAGLSDARKLSNVFKAFQKAKNGGAWLRELSELTPIIENSSKGIRVIALTPSSESIKQYTEYLFDAIAKKGECVRSVPDRLHNLIASAICVSVGSVNIIIGSDLEKGTNGSTGWSGVLSNPDKPDLSVNVIKVSHHGSSNAFHKGAWDEHQAKSRPISILTPYIKGINFLPKDTDINRLEKVSKKVGVTAKIKQTAPKKTYSREILRAVGNNVGNWRIIKPQDELGLIRIRLNSDGKIKEEIAIPPAYWFKSKVS